MLEWGFSILFDTTWLSGGIFAVSFWLALVFRKKVTYPRIGYAKPAEQRKQMARLIIAGTLTLLLGIMVFLLVVTHAPPQFLRDYFELLFGTILAIVIGLIGYWWGIVRWYYYAGLVFVLASFNQWLGLSFDLSFIISGGVILLYGLTMLVRFLRKYPRVSSEGFDDNQQG